MRPSFGHGRGKKLYRYYVSETLLPNGQIGNISSLFACNVGAIHKGHSGVNDNSDLALTALGLPKGSQHKVADVALA